MGGATAAKYLRLWGGSGVEVILIDRSAQYYSCILSNLVLNGTRTLKELTFDYTTMVQRYGINFIQSEVSNLDLAGQQVVLSDGSKVPYDRLVLSPGVEFDTSPVWKPPPRNLPFRTRGRLAPKQTYCATKSRRCPQAASLF
jgi:NADH dehydrogenase FAD-containing subunit